VAELKCAHDKELADATIHEPNSEEKHKENCFTNWIPDALLPNCLEERILQYLRTADGQQLYDVTERCWSPTILPPILRQPHKNGGRGKREHTLDTGLLDSLEEEKGSDKMNNPKPQNDEKMLASFFNMIMWRSPKPSIIYAMILEGHQLVDAV
jgi:hypothetical protein